MSKEAALAFRDKVSETPQLQDHVRRAIEAGESLDEAVRLGRKEGFDFTAAEAREALSEVGSGELSDFELEIVAGGKRSQNNQSDNNSNQGNNDPDRASEPQQVSSSFLTGHKSVGHISLPKHGW